MTLLPGPRCECGNLLTIEDRGSRCRQCVLELATRPTRAAQLAEARRAWAATKPGTPERHEATRAWLALHPSLG